MNYQRIYDQIIDRAKLRGRPEGYCERHHILPKSMGGTWKKENLVLLTAKEHFIAHMLLFKIHRNREMACAWRAMAMKDHRTHGRYTSRNFEYMRRHYSEFMSKHFSGEGNPQYGKKASEETRKKLSDSRRGDKHHYYGKKRSDEQREAIRRGRVEALGRAIKVTHPDGTIKVFLGTPDAASHYGINRSTVRYLCENEKAPSKKSVVSGHVFKFISREELATLLEDIANRRNSSI